MGVVRGRRSHHCMISYLEGITSSGHGKIDTSTYCSAYCCACDSTASTEPMKDGHGLCNTGMTVGEYSLIEDGS